VVANQARIAMRQQILAIHHKNVLMEPLTINAHPLNRNIVQAVV
jgi:hypothetical protein